MSRILHHVGRNDFKKTRQRQIGEQKERAAQKLKEWQEAEAERKQIEEAARPYKSNWRRENLREFGEWAPIETSGPTNGTSTTFGYFVGGSPAVNYETGQQITFTYSGLDGIENYPTSITIDQGFGEVHTTNPPPFSQIGVQGYTAKLNPRYAEAQKKYQEEMKEWERKKEQQQKDIEATLKSFGTSYRDIQRDGGITRVGNSYVAIIGTNTRDFGSDLLNNIRVVRLVPCDPSQPMELTKNIRDISGIKKWNVSNAQYSHDVYLQIGEQPKAPIEQEYLMPRRTDFKDVNPQLDASQEFAQKVGADEFMNARVQGTGPDAPSPFRGHGSQYGPLPSPTPFTPSTKFDVTVTPEDEAFIDYMERYPNFVNNLFPGQAAAATSVINYARGNYSDITQSPGRSANQSILNIISRIHKPGERGGAATAGLNPGQDPSDNNMDKAYPHGPLNAPMRNFLNQFNYEVTSDGVRIIDTFNFNDNRNTGWLGNIRIKGPDGNAIKIQDIAARLSDIGDRRARSMGLDPASDSFGGKIDFTIPWNEVPARIRNQLDPTQTISPIVKRNRRGRVIESTWNKLQKHR